MSFAETMASDLDTIYNTKEIAVSATHLDNEISIIFQDDLDLFGTEQIVILTSSSNNINEGDIITISNINYEVINHDYKDDYRLEYLVALKKQLWPKQMLFQ